MSQRSIKEESPNSPSPSLEKQDTISFVDEEEPEETNEYFFYHSAHGNLDLEYPLVRKETNPHPLGWPLVDAINPDKTITLLIKTNSIMGSTTLSSQTTLTGDFGLDFVSKEKRFKNYLKIVIHNRQIVLVDVLDPPPPPPPRGDLLSRIKNKDVAPQKQGKWVSFYNAEDRKSVDLPNVRFSYDSKENAGFHCGFLQLVKVPLEEGNPQSEYIFNNVSKTPDGENDWIPGPELRNPEEKGTAFIHGPDNSVIDKILSLVESELSSPQPITITIYNSSCLYEPDHIKLIERFPAWAYLYRKYITTESKNSLKEFETERRKQLQEKERIQKGIQDFTKAQSGWREVLGDITLKLQKEGIIKYIVENPVYSNLKPGKEADWVEYKKNLETMELADLEREAEKNKYEAPLMVEDIKNGFTFFKNPEYMNIYSQIYTIESHLEKLKEGLTHAVSQLENTDLKIRKIKNNLASQKELEKLGPFIEHPEGKRVKRRKKDYGGKKKKKKKPTKNKKKKKKKKRTKRTKRNKRTKRTKRTRRTKRTKRTKNRKNKLIGGSAGISESLPIGAPPNQKAKPWPASSSTPVATQAWANLIAEKEAEVGEEYRQQRDVQSNDESILYKGIDTIYLVTSLPEFGPGPGEGEFLTPVMQMVNNLQRRHGNIHLGFDFAKSIISGWTEAADSELWALLYSHLTDDSISKLNGLKPLTDKEKDILENIKNNNKSISEEYQLGDNPTDLLDVVANVIKNTAWWVAYRAIILSGLRTALIALCNENIRCPKNAVIVTIEGGTISNVERKYMPEIIQEMKTAFKTDKRYGVFHDDINIKHLNFKDIDSAEKYLNRVALPVP